MQLLRGDERCLAGESLADLLLLVPQRAQFVARWRGLGFDGHVAADGARGLLERGEHMVAELAGHLTAHLGGDVRVAVAVGTDPAARVEERGACRRLDACLVAEHPVVETTVDHRNRVEQRVVEDVENRVGLFDRRRLLQRNRRRAEQCVDLAVQATAVLLLVGAAEQTVRFEQLCDAADLAFHGLAARLGGVCSEHRVEFEAFEQLLGLGRTHFGDELVVGLRHLVHRIDGLGVVDLGLALMEHGHTVSSPRTDSPGGSTWRTRGRAAEHRADSSHRSS